ncbi:MAG: hypothetical protein OEV40_24120 [Acidimicrobiia bacterium]|nr:hypothetical protein [Acidimicrobiia bacterium]
MSELARAFGVTPVGWERVREPSLAPAFTAIGAWLVMAWNRFGLQGLSAPRAGTRFVLIGFYSWIGLGLLVWLAGRVADRRRQEPMPLFRPTQLTGLAHRPILVMAVLLQLTGILAPAAGIGTAAAVLVFGLWMPAMLVSAVNWAYDLPVVQAIALTAVPYLLWLATAGSFLFVQVGHLL